MRMLLSMALESQFLWLKGWVTSNRHMFISISYPRNLPMQYHIEISDRHDIYKTVIKITNFNSLQSAASLFIT